MDGDDITLGNEDESELEDHLPKTFTKTTKKFYNFNLRKNFKASTVLPIFFLLPGSVLYGISILASAIITSPNPCTMNGLDSIYTSIIFIFQSFVSFILFPVGGWLSDTSLGRYRVIYISLWLFWLGVAIMAFGIVLLLFEPCSGPLYIIGKYICNILALISISLGSAGFFPNILVFTMDQMVGASSSQLRSCILWFVWSLYVGFFFSDWITVASQLTPPQTLLNWFALPVFVELVLFSLILVFNFFFESIFTVVFLKTNPYKAVYEILRFASKHKYPIKRSALTYWEEDLPSRIDLAKLKYGGPHSHEMVESVKTLLNMLLLYCSMMPFFIAYSGPINQIIPFIQHLEREESMPLVSVIYLSEPLITILAIPILQLVVLPLFPNLEYFISRPLRWLFVGMISLTLCNIALVIISVAAHNEDNMHTACFINWMNGDESLTFHSYPVVLIPSLLWGVCDLFITTSTFIFICSQAPCNMRGMLLGLFMFMQGFFQSIGDSISTGFAFSRASFLISCGFTYWLTLSLFSVFSCIVFAFGARFYHSRIRSDVDTHRQLIEDVFERRLERASSNFHLSNLSELRKIKKDQENSLVINSDI